MAQKSKLRPIETCPNGHFYNANSYGDTCPVCDAKLDEDSRKTPEELAEELALEKEDWVCGWLVCVSGVNKGRSYEIRAGKNPIGSDITMRIRVLGDPQIERRNHGVIAYDAQKVQTNILAGDSNGLVYVEGRAIFNPTNLTSYDRLQIGDSHFIFVTLCNENFDWGKEAGN